MAIAGVAGMAVGISGLLYHKACENSLKRAQFLQDAVAEMAKHEEVINLLGGEYKVGSVDRNDPWNKVEKSQTRFRLPIEGTKRNANLLIFAHRNDDEKIKIDRIEMMFDKIDRKRLLILDGPVKVQSENKSAAEEPIRNERGEELLFIKKT